MGAVLFVLGCFLLVFGFPVSIFLTIFFCIRKRGFSIFKISIPIVISASLFLMFVGLIITPSVETEETTNQKQEMVENDSEDSEDNKKEAEEKSKEEIENEIRKELEKEAKEKAEKEKAKQFEYADTSIKYLRSEIDYNSIDDKCLFVYFEFTNNSDENQTFSYLVNCQAFQNGIELSTNYIYDCDEERNGSKEIQPGTTITVAEVFELGESTENVTLEITPFSIWSDRKLFEYEISLSE